MDRTVMKKLDPIFSGQKAPGIYRLTSRAKPSNVLAAVSDHGWQDFYLDGSVVFDKESFLQAGAEAMHFPAYFGHNWDAFEECVTELTWRPASGYVLLYDKMARLANGDPQAWTTAQSILEDAIDYWQAASVPFYVLLRGTWWHGRKFPNI
jgi:hypothetical protein